MITSKNGDIEYVNPAFERLTGYSAEEILGKNARILNSGEHDESFHQDLWETIRGGEVWKGHLTNRKKDGSLLQEEATISPVFDDNGQIINYVAVKRDVTKERQLEHQLRQTQKMEAIGTLAGGIAHDFNNILFAILGNAEMALDRLKAAGQDVDEIEDVITAGHRAKDLVRQILTFSRKSDMQLIPVDIISLVIEVAKLVRSTFPTSIELKLKLEVNQASVKADPSQLHQVLMNLCTNARQAMLESGGTLTLKLRTADLDADFAETHGLKAPGAYVVLEVSDTGTGIPKEILGRIFEPFFTTKTKEEGTGLGLSMVHGIVADFGGAIFVYSEPGVGTTFKVFLPLVQVKNVDGQSCDIEIPKGTETLLIVDDEITIAKLTGKMMSGLGYSVETFTSGTEALASFKATPAKYDLLITDQTMPWLSGVELATQALQVRPDLPVILCSGFSETITKEGAKQLGIREFLTKPVSKRELAQVVRNSLNDQKLTQRRSAV